MELSEKTDEDLDNSLKEYLEELIREDEKRRDPNIRKMRLVNRNVGRRTGMIITTVKGLRDIDGLFPMDEFYVKPSVESSLTNNNGQEVPSVSSVQHEPEATHSKSYINQSTQYSATRTDVNTTNLRDAAISPMSAREKSSSASRSRKMSSSSLLRRSTSVKKSASGARYKPAVSFVEDSRKSYVAEDVIEKYVQLMSGKKTSEMGSNRRLSKEQKQATPKPRISLIKRRLTFSTDGTKNLLSSEENEQDSPAEVRFIHPVYEADETSDHKVQSSPKKTTKSSHKNSNKTLTPKENGNITRNKSQRNISHTDHSRSNFDSSTHTNRTASSSRRPTLVRYSLSDNSDSSGETTSTNGKLRNSPPKYFKSYAESDLEIESSDSAPEIRLSARRKSRNRNKENEKSSRLEVEEKRTVDSALRHVKPGARRKSSNKNASKMNGQVENLLDFEIASSPFAAEADSLRGVDHQQARLSVVKTTKKNNTSTKKNLTVPSNLRESVELTVDKNMTQRRKSSAKRQSEINILDSGTKSGAVQKASTSKTKQHKGRTPVELVSSESESDVRMVWKRDALYLKESDDFKFSLLFSRTESPEAQMLKRSGTGDKPYTKVDNKGGELSEDDDIGYSTGTRIRARKSALMSEMNYQSVENEKSSHISRSARKSIPRSATKHAKGEENKSSSKVLRHGGRISNQSIFDNQIDRGPEHIEEHSSVASQKKNRFSDKSSDDSRRKSSALKTRSERGEVERRRSQRMRKARQSSAKASEIQTLDSNDSDGRKITISKTKSKTKNKLIFEDEESATRREKSKNVSGNRGSYTDEGRTESKKSVHETSGRKKDSARSTKKNENKSHNANSLQMWLRTSQSSANKSRIIEEKLTAESDDLTDHHTLKVAEEHPTLPGVDESTILFSRGQKKMYLHDVGGPPASTPRISKTIRRVSSAGGQAPNPVDFGNNVDDNIQEIDERSVSEDIHSNSSQSSIGKYVAPVEEVATLWPPPSSSSFFQNLNNNTESSEKAESKTKKKTAFRKTRKTQTKKIKQVKSLSSKSRRRRKSESTESPECSPQKKYKTNSSEGEDQERKAKSKGNKTDLNPCPYFPPPELIIPQPSPEAVRLGLRRSRRVRTRPLHSYLGESIISEKLENGDVKYSVVQSLATSYDSKPRKKKVNGKKSRRTKSKESPSKQSRVPEKHHEKSSIENEQTLMPSVEASPPQQQLLSPEPSELRSTLVSKNVWANNNLLGIIDIDSGLDKPVNHIPTTHEIISSLNPAEQSGRKSKNSDTETSHLYRMNGTETFFGPTGNAILPGDPLRISVAIRGNGIFQGKLVINPLGKKSSRHVGNTIMCFYVEEGVVVVALNDIEKQFEPKSYFRVPKNYCYKLYNPSKDQQACLVYTMFNG